MSRYFRALLLAYFGAATFATAQTTNIYTTSTTWTVPANVNSISIKVYGGGGGTGGQDCGAGCTNAAAGPVGYLIAAYSVTSGDVVGIYPAGKGGNGSDDESGSGGGTGGVASYNVSYRGGNGGNAGNFGASGGGGGGGAASVATINSVIKMVAGGAGGGGGMANFSNSGLPGTSGISSNGTNAGGNGESVGNDDGGGAGGGGGGQFGSNGGSTYYNDDAGEVAGEGGYRGGNSISGAASTTTNGTISWTSAGRIEITYTSSLPVTWLDFKAIKQSNRVLLQWRTASEQHTKDFQVEKSRDGSNWKLIGNVPAAGNSNSVTEYSFIDAQPAKSINLYRLMQRDLDNKYGYSKIVALDWQQDNSTLLVYPNPAPSGVVTIYLQESAVVSIYKSDGKKVLTKQLDAGLHRLNLSAQSKGQYFLKASHVNASIVLFLK